MNGAEHDTGLNRSQRKSGPGEEQERSSVDLSLNVLGEHILKLKSILDDMGERIKPSLSCSTPEPLNTACKEVQDNNMCQIVERLRTGTNEIKEMQSMVMDLIGRCQL